MKVEDLLNKLYELKIKLWVENGKLRYSAPKGIFTTDLRNQIINYKSKIIQLLKQTKSTDKSEELIDILPRDKDLELSFAQQRLWFLNQLEKGKATTYNMPPFVMKLNGDLVISNFEKALDEILLRHESLRTSFQIKNGIPIQNIHKTIDSYLFIYNLHQYSEKKQNDEIKRITAEESKTIFDLTKTPLFRVVILKLNRDEHVLIITMHHIISDGWSLGIFFKELCLIYNAYCDKKPSPLPPQTVQYADFGQWQRKRLSGEYLETLKNYWKKQLADAPALLELPTDYSRPPIQRYRGKAEYHMISKELSQKLTDLSNQSGVTLFMTLLSAFGTLLYRYTSQEDIIIGSPVANRTHNQLNNIIGFFLNTLVMRINFENNPCFDDLLQQVKKISLTAYEYQDYPFEQLVDDLQLERNLSYTPVFQVLFVLQNAPIGDTELTNLTITQLPTENINAIYDLILSVEETPDGLKAKFRYNTDLFETNTIKRLIIHFQTLLQGIVTNPKQRLQNLPLLTENEYNQLKAWNNTDVKYPLNYCLHQLFEQQVEKTPDDIAVIFENQKLTYKELNIKSNQLASYLQTFGVVAETMVGICVERSLEMVIGLYGIIKAGGAYVPIDPEYPSERLKFMIEDANAPVILTQGKFFNELKLINKTAQIIPLDTDTNWQKQNNKENLNIEIRPDNLAYMIYTSGSTGKPKGAMNTHIAICNRLLWMQDAYQLTSEDNVLQKTPFSFDVSVWEFFWPLITGAHLIVAKPGGHKDSSYLVEFIIDHNITTLHFVPSMLQIFVQDPNVDKCHSLKRVICSGEALPFELQENLFDKLPTVNIYNLYGPTEAAIDVTHWTCLHKSPLKKVPIGSPIANIQMHILDTNLHPVPIGAPGELHIGGIGLARGYHNREELTKEKFIKDPFSDKTGDRLYKTGDLARYLYDGNIEYLGRIDNQVKIRGFRIELGEIENTLTQHPKVKETVVVGLKDKGVALRLVAYVVKDPKETLTSNDLRNFLHDELPEYMLPSFFIMMDALPLSPNGKVDRRALPSPDSVRPDLETTYVSPKTKIERMIAELWQEILDIKKIGIHDHFFELGGDSIKGAIFVNKLQEKLNKIIYVVAIFEAPTISKFIDYIKKHYPEILNEFDGIKQTIASKEIKKIDALDFVQFRKIIKPLELKKTNSKNPQAIFVLSPPRSGSTLLRVLLGGHPLLFAPPELELLSFNTLEQRLNAFTARNSFWLEGNLRAMMGIKGYDADQAKLEMEQYEKNNLSTQQMYKLLQDWLKGKILVDKSPSYAIDVNILKQAENYFENPLYIHLLRHPYGMINSFEEAKLDQIFFLYDHDYSTRELAELIFLQSHVNILEFFEHIPSSRKHTVKFEDITSQTESVIKDICAFINLDFHSDMLKPYQEKQKRMTDGIYKESRMLGDVKFLDHKKIKSQVSDRWRHNYTLDFLGDITWQIATKIGYQKDLGLNQSNKNIEIKRIQRSENLPISFAQQRLWFLDQYEEESTTYNISIAIQLDGQLKIDILQQSLQAIIDRHESLQSTFHKDNGIPVVKILKKPLQFDILDLRNLSDEQRSTKAEELILEECHLPFNLSEGPLFRSKLLQLDKNAHILLVSMHHIVSDGWSIGILIKDWTTLYKAFSEGLESPLPELPIQYVDYANWQRQWLKGEEYHRQVSYWKKQLKGIPELLELPTDFSRPPAQSFNGMNLHFSLSSELTDKLKKLSQVSDCTLFMTLISGFSILMAKYSGQEDIVLGSPIANRNHKDIESLIGFFVNTLVLRHDLSNNPSFKDFLKQNRNVILDAYGHQDISFEQLVEELQPTRSLSHSPLFQVLFVLQNAPSGELELPDLTITPINQDTEISKFDLSMILEENDKTSGIDGTVEFNTDLFKPETIQRLISHFKNLLQEIVKDPGQSILQYDIMSPAELETILYKWNETSTSYAKDKCIHELFEQQVEKTPDKIAVIFQDQTITYRELNHRANELAHHLRSLNIKAEDLIGIYMERSLEMVIGLLGILKSGGAYIPLDPTYPMDRIKYMIEDSETNILLTQAHLLEKIDLKDIHTICLDKHEFFQDRHHENPGNNTSPSNLAYVIFTSGSTGRPKGVMLTHQAVNNFISSMRLKPGLTEQDILMAVTTISFDIAVLELYLPLTTGAQIILASNEMTKDGALLLECIKKFNVTVMQATPATWQLLLSCGWEKMDSLKILCGGEALPHKLASQLLEKGKDVWNLYGPTETTVWSSLCKVDQNENQEVHDTPLPLGYPIANTQTYILNTYNQLVPIGVPGELHIGGDGLARGYLKRPELTAEKFIQNPFINDPDTLIYKTGDLVRYLPDGNIEYSCRLDNQVKIRGYRIELGEIESLLTKHPAVKQAVVIVKADQAGEKSLVAYIISQQDEKVDSSEIKFFLSKGLPVYMIPSIYVSLDQMPLTPNGKINRLALPEPDLQSINRGDSTLVTPRDTLEIQLARLWEEVLKVQPIGIRDNFFDLGGHSLLAVRLMAKIEQAFNKHLPLATLFKNGTIELLANHIRHNQDESSWSSLVLIQPDGSKPPFFCLPGAGGNVLYFQELAMNLGKERPFYGLQPPGLDGGTPPLTTIEDLAAHYIKTIKTVQETGPYYLGGHSFGGLVAFEMAQQLTQKGEQVNQLAILDCPCPTYSQPTGEDWDEARWLSQIANIISHLYGKDLGITEDSFKPFNDDEKSKFLHEQLKEYDFLPKEAKLSHFKGFVDVYKTNLLMTIDANKDIYPTNLVLFKSTDRQPLKLEHDNTYEIRDDHTLGWNTFLSKDIDVCMIPGDHLTMLTNPNVKELAKQINEFII
ncbi:amino acid adenylation domain protein [Candidatus Magnetomorum sp. HK-1]|nr:amino acid adenylation domain protein [Candidatus Magnetomorum sp. HK-1]